MGDKLKSSFVDLPMVMRSAQLGTYDEKKRTAEMVFSTGARVQRWDWEYGAFIEELSLDPAHVRMDRIKQGAAPFLKDHRGGTIDNVLGRILSATVDGKEGKATVLFSSREDVQPIVQDIAEGILPNVSVGYQVYRFEKVGEENGVPVLRATDWEPFEISSVAINADAPAQFRSAESGSERVFRCEVRGFAETEKTNSEEDPEKTVVREESLTEDQTTGDIEAMNEAERKAAEDLKLREAEAKRIADEARAEGARVERERQVEIRRAVRAAGLEESFAEEMIKDGAVTVDVARGRVIDKLAARDAEKPTRSVHVEAGSQDETLTRRESVQEAILHRAMPEKYKLTEKGREFAGMRLMEMAREVLRRQGIKTGHMGPNELAGRALHSTSDFPHVLADIVNKTLRDAFVAAPQTFDPIVKRVQNPDFKQISRVQLGMGSSLSEILEAGEITYGTVGESSEKYFLKEYAKGLSITRRILINDDLEAFTRIPAQMGAKAKSLESDLVWAVITANAAMADSVALFASGHGNLAASGSVISIASLAAGRAAVRAQKEMDGEPLNLPVSYLIVPTELETIAEQFISQVQANVQSANNPFAQGGRTPLGLIVEPRLSAASATAWYMASSKALVDLLELATLSGSTEPEVAMEEGFDTLGMKFRVVHSVGTKAIDWRGLYKNPGA